MASSTLRLLESMVSPVPSPSMKCLAASRGALVRVWGLVGLTLTPFWKLWSSVHEQAMDSWVLGVHELAMRHWQTEESQLLPKNVMLYNRCCLPYLMYPMLTENEWKRKTTSIQTMMKRQSATAQPHVTQLAANFPVKSYQIIEHPDRFGLLWIPRVRSDDSTDHLHRGNTFLRNIQVQERSIIALIDASVVSSWIPATLSSRIVDFSYGDSSRFSAVSYRSRNSSTWRWSE